MDNNTTLIVSVLGTGVVTFIFGYVLHVFTKRSDRYDELEKRIRDLELGHKDISYIKEKQAELDGKIDRILDTVTNLRVEMSLAAPKRIKKGVEDA